MKVCIGPGHGGHDSGAIANAIVEKEVNLTVALLARDTLRSDSIDVVMTRTRDEYVSLMQRTAMANEEQADAFISIHHNAAENQEARGVEVYHSILGGAGRVLAEYIHSQYRIIIPHLPSRGVRTRQRQDGSDYYHVIRETAMPAVIVEGAFLSNPQDAELIRSTEFLQKKAKAIFLGILAWQWQASPGDDLTPILGSPRAGSDQAREWARLRNAHQRFMDIAPVYLEYGRLTGLRPEVLYAQSAKETAFGRFEGAVLPQQNNWAGIKARDVTGDGPEDHESFPSPEEGVRAHFNHMSAYVGLRPIGEPHGRYHTVMSMPWAGTVRYVEELGGKWAPDSQYGVSIVRDYLHHLLEEDPEKEGAEQGRWQRLLDVLRRLLGGFAG